jgi:hypothetical protein
MVGPAGFARRRDGQSDSRAISFDVGRSSGRELDMAVPIPKFSVLNDFEYLGVFGGQKRWRSDNGKRLYTWDSFHGEVEVFNRRGEHLGALDPVTGDLVKEAVPGRRIDV